METRSSPALDNARRDRRAGVLLALLAGLTGGACKKTPPEPEPDTLLGAGWADLKATQEYRFPAVRRLVAIGDVHGDLPATKRALRLAGAVNDDGSWTGGDLVVVQTGDELDRGDDDRAVFDYLDGLRRHAAKAGGALHLLNGNHELMNVAGDFRYVSAAAALPFASGGLSGEEGRRRAFAPGGEYAKKLAERNVVEIIGDTVFVHGGILPEHVRADLGKINEAVRQWILGRRVMLPPIAEGPTSPVWTRALSDGEPSASACRALSSTLTQLGVRRLVVGHTIQDQGINAACDGLVWRIDVGLSRAARDHSSEVLEIADGKARAIVQQASKTPG